MGRGAYVKSKPAKATQVDAPASSRLPSVPSIGAKLTRTNTDWRRAGIPTSFLSRNSSVTSVSSLASSQSLPVQDSSFQSNEAASLQRRQQDLSADSASIRSDTEYDNRYDAASSSLPDELEQSVRPTTIRNLSAQSSGDEDTYKADLAKFEDLTIEETESSASSIYSRDSASLFSKDSASTYSSSSSIFSSGASIYSIDEDDLKENDRYANGSTEQISREGSANLDPRVPSAAQYQRRALTVPVRRDEPQSAASRERNSLARKAALFKNSRLPPNLPSFSTSLPTWSMVCRAVQASQDCYDSRALTRRGTYTPADTAKDIKAMIVDDQFIDQSRFIIVSIRGTECQSLTDWAVNKAANPVKPVGFLDDEENACHAGFLQVSKAMISQVAAQLQQYSDCSDKPSLLFTGHSAGGAIAAMLYSHMLATSVASNLTVLASQFSSINCVTFGAPPLSVTPLPRRDNGSGVFLTFANEGDPVLRLSNAAYVKSLAKLMTVSVPSGPPVKVVRRSRGSSVIRQTYSDAPSVPWEELPLWPTPPAPLANGGDVILLRDNDHGRVTASPVTSDDMSDVIFGDLAQHTMEKYIRRVKEVALGAMMGRM